MCGKEEHKTMQLQFNLTHINKKSGKRLHRQQVKTALAAGLKQESCLFYIHDKNTRYLFLVDTGSQISVIPSDPKKNHHQSHCKQQMDQELKPTEI